MIAILAGVLVFFSPHGGCTAEIVKEISAAKTSVHVQSYSFTSQPIADALLSDKARGLDVRVLFDKSWRTEMMQQHHDPLPVESKIIASIPTLIDGKHSIAHNKIIIIDSTEVLTGSFNHTNQAETSNAENLLVIRNAKIAAKYEANWQLHAAHSLPVVATAANFTGNSPLVSWRKTDYAEDEATGQTYNQWIAWFNSLPLEARSFPGAGKAYWRQWYERGFTPEFAWKNTDPKQVHNFSRPLLLGEKGEGEK